MRLNASSQNIGLVFLAELLKWDMMGFVALTELHNCTQHRLRAQFAATHSIQDSVAMARSSRCRTLVTVKLSFLVEGINQPQHILFIALGALVGVPHRRISLLVFFSWGIPQLQSDWSLSCDHGLDYAS